VGTPSDPSRYGNHPSESQGGPVVPVLRYGGVCYRDADEAAQRGIEVFVIGCKPLGEVFQEFCEGNGVAGVEQQVWHGVAHLFEPSRSSLSAWLVGAGRTRTLLRAANAVLRQVISVCWAANLEIAVVLNSLSSASWLSRSFRRFRSSAI
jgi:hypothetical protein